MAATRPLIAAEPTLRAPRPEKVWESTLTGPDACGFAGCGVCACAATPAASAKLRNDDDKRRVSFVFISLGILLSWLSQFLFASVSAGGFWPLGGFSPGFFVAGFSPSGCFGGVVEASGALAGCDFAAGWRKRLSSKGTLVSIFSYVTLDLNWLPFGPLSTEKGKYQPSTSL